MKIENSVEINATPRTVFYWLAEPERAERWVISVTRSEIIRETPNKVGTTFREYVEEDGRGIEMNGVVTEFVPDELFAVHLESKVNEVDVRFSLREKEGVTQLVQNVDLRLRGLLKVVGLFLRASIRERVSRQAQNEFLRLKQLCETEAVPSD